MLKANGARSTSGAGGLDAPLDLRPLPPSFFARATLDVAADLLGRVLVRRLADGTRLAARIVETEAYRGEDDLACHAARGRTPRNDVLYRRCGTLYIYFIYGMHWLVNVVTEQEGIPAAVLLRAAEPIMGLSSMRGRRPGRRDHELLRGPANLSRALAIDGSLNGMRATTTGLRFARGAPFAANQVTSAPRVGVDYAGPAAAWPWRFLVLSSRSVSKPAPSTRPAGG